MKRLKIQKMDKRALQFKLAFFALIAASLLIIAIGNWISDWNTTYSSAITYDLNSYNKLNTLSNESESQKDSVVVKSTNTGEDFEGTSIRGVFGVLNNIYEPFRIVFGSGGMIDSLNNRFGAPDYISLALLNFFIVAITFTLVAIFFRLSRSTA